MVGTDKANKMIQYVYWSIQIMNYLVFLTLDISKSYPLTSSRVKYASIILCFLYAIYSKKKERSAYILAGLFFTVISDYFLLFTKDFAWGMLSFCVTQTMYSIYCSKDKRQFLIKEVIQICAIGGIMLVLPQVVFIKIDIVIIVSAYYFIHLLSNVLFSWICSKEGRYRKLFAIGMTLFLLCDIHVAMYNAGSYLNVSSSHVYQKIYEVATVAMWFYYLPSQVLIAMVGRKNLI
ncbi:lysoplasmalogenase family protein [Anaerosporobacter sp.]|uniref:lysoplasmalogenase family protein n=1 Tax=Anaerosporobacter sp. TaxID=1872529 RepID=UPI00286ED7CE|nr:lysoplasmalogenase family protein [Anaerosporobacter sp.]